MRRLMVATALSATLVAGSAMASRLHTVTANPADALVRLPIDAYRYDYAKHCVKRPQKGTLALENWLAQNAQGVSWGILRCERLGAGYSLHAEGRALDWHPADRREAYRVIGLLLAADAAANQHALARRMGIQEIIYDCRAWFTGDGEMIRYSACYDKHGKPVKIDDTTAHRNHIHIGLNWAGAREQTTFWGAHAAHSRR